MKDCEILYNYKIFNENLKVLAFYLVSLYYKTGCKYLCSITKINRLLTIYKFCTLKYNDESLRGEYIINTSMWFDSLWFCIYKEEYFNENLMKQECKEITEEINEFAEVPEKYKVEHQIGVSSKILLEKIFRKFGNYSLNDLGPMIDEIIFEMPTKKIDGKKDIDVNNFKKSLYVYPQNLNNEVLNFIKNFDLDIELYKYEKNIKVKEYKKH